MSVYTKITLIFWDCFYFYWMWAALRVKKTAQRQSWQARLAHMAILLSGYALVFLPALSLGALAYPLVPNTPFIGWLGVSLSFLGIAFTLWARVQLGRNWSGTVTLKLDHELIQSGPYGITRHPIYSGLILALLGSALTVGLVRAFLGLCLVTFCFHLKMAQEETFLTSLFGKRYLTYMRRVKRLIPFIY